MATGYRSIHLDEEEVQWILRDLNTCESLHPEYVKRLQNSETRLESAQDLIYEWVLSLDDYNPHGKAGLYSPRFIKSRRWHSTKDIWVDLEDNKSSVVSEYKGEVPHIERHVEGVRVVTQRSKKDSENKEEMDTNGQDSEYINLQSYNNPSESDSKGLESGLEDKEEDRPSLGNRSQYDSTALGAHHQISTLSSSVQQEERSFLEEFKEKNPGIELVGKASKDRIAWADVPPNSNDPILSWKKDEGNHREKKNKTKGQQLVWIQVRNPKIPVEFTLKEGGYVFPGTAWRELSFYEHTLVEGPFATPMVFLGGTLISTFMSRELYEASLILEYYENQDLPVGWRTHSERMESFRTGRRLQVSDRSEYRWNELKPYIDQKYDEVWDLGGGEETVGRRVAKELGANYYPIEKTTVIPDHTPKGPVLVLAYSSLHHMKDMKRLWLIFEKVGKKAKLMIREHDFSGPELVQKRFRSFLLWHHACFGDFSPLFFHDWSYVSCAFKHVVTERISHNPKMRILLMACTGFKT